MAKWTLPDTQSPEALVKAALERAEYAVGCQSAPIRGTPYAAGPRVFCEAIRAIAKDPAAVAQIIEDAKEGRE